MVRCTDCPGMTIAVNWDVKHQNKQTKQLATFVKCGFFRKMDNLVLYTTYVD